jgi:transporter family-2 protein
MTPALTLALLSAAGIALVFQNILMVRLAEAASTPLVALVINSSVGLVLLVGLLLGRNGFGGLGEVAGVFRPWALLPGLLGSFFVFAGIAGYQRLGAAPTIATLVASQLIAGLVIDAVRAPRFEVSSNLAALAGAVLLIAGAVLVVRRSF